SVQQQRRQLVPGGQVAHLPLHRLHHPRRRDLTRRRAAMRYLLIAGLMCAMAAPLAMARAIPDPNQKHAPGNEAPQTPISEAGYSTPVNYQLQCAGCHLGDGTGSRANDTPKMKDFVG